MAKLPVDTKVASIYRKLDAANAAQNNTSPIFQGMEDDKVLFMAKKLDPNFSTNYNQAYNGSPFGDKAGQTIGDTENKIGSGIDKVSSALNQPIVGPIGDFEGKVFDTTKALNDKIQPIVDSLESNPGVSSDPKSLGNMTGLNRPLPESPAGAIGLLALHALLGGGMSKYDNASNTFGDYDMPGPSGGPASEKIQSSITSDTTPPKLAATAQAAAAEPPKISPELQKVSIPNPKNIAESYGIGPVEVHGQIGQDLTSYMQDSHKNLVDSKYATEKRIFEDSDAETNRTIPVDDVGRILHDLKKSDPNISVHPALQNPTLQAISNIYEKRLEAANSEEGPKQYRDFSDLTEKGDEHDITGFAQNDHEGVNIDQKGAVDLHKALNGAYQSNYGTGPGHFLGEITKSLNKSIMDNGSEALQQAHGQTMAVSKDFYDTYYNKTAVQKYINASPDVAHKVALQNVRNLSDIQLAGGDLAVEHVRRAHTQDVLNDIVNKNWNGDRVSRELSPRENPVMGKLYSDEQVGRLASTADMIQQAKAKNKALDKMSSVHDTALKADETINKSEAASMDSAHNSALADDVTMQKKHMQELSDLASKQAEERKSIQQNRDYEASQQLTTGQKAIIAAKKAAVVGLSGAAGAYVGGTAGGIGGAALGVGLSDLIHK